MSTDMSTDTCMRISTSIAIRNYCPAVGSLPPSLWLSLFLSFSLSFFLSFFLSLSLSVSSCMENAQDAKCPGRGEAVVVAMWSTGESVTEAVANRKGDRSAAAAGFASAPKEVWRIVLHRH